VFNQNPFDRNRSEVREQGPNPAAYGYAGGPTAGMIAVPREGYLTAAFVWMFLALLVSAATAAMTIANEDALATVLDWWWLLLIGQFALVIVLSAAINRMSSTVAVLMLFVYAALTGATLSVIVLSFTVASVTSAFVGAAAIFGAAALFGAVTRRDLTSLGGLLFAGLIGIVVASLVNIFIGGTTLSFVIGIVGVLVFTGLTAWDVQRIKSGRLTWVLNAQNASVVAALSLYLDFINLFLLMLRLFGRRR
jgi:FtsH-binding integral membrane protein